MLDASGLALWLRVSASKRATGMAELIASTDLRVVTQGDVFSVERGHHDPVTRLETGSTLPLMAAAFA